MATPTATPPQTDPEPTPEPSPGPLAQMLTPVQPARPTTHLGTTASLAQDTPADDTSTTGGGKRGKDTPGDGPFGALVRALATRLGRTGTATSVKQNHTITENRVSGNSSNTTHANKTDRGTQHRSNRDAKLADLNNKVHQHHGKTNQDVKKANTADAKSSKADTRAAKNDNSAKRDDKNHRDGRTDAKTAKTDSNDAKSSDTKSTKNDSAARNDTSQRKDDRKSGSTDTKTTRTDVPATSGRDAGPFDTAPTKRSKDGGSDGSGPAKDPKPPTGQKVDLTKAGDPSPAAAKGAGPDPTAKSDGPTDKMPKADPKGLNTKVNLAKKPQPAIGTVQPDQTPSPAVTPRPRTRSSREAGYRDGRRAATVAGHVQAWGDGVRDGWDDGNAANHAERKQMDDARARNAIRPDRAPAAPKMNPASGSTVDLAKKPETPAERPVTVPPKPTTPPTIPAQGAAPAQVTSVGAKDITFNADGAQHSMSRGEVRTLKQFERRLADKKVTLGRIAEGSKNTRALAVELATRAQRLAEDAKAVKGGDGVVTVLLRLAERAQLLRSKAEEIEKNAHRGAEAVKVLAANAETRHGGIYRAVVDSPLTIPAEREFYQDKQGS